MHAINTTCSKAVTIVNSHS